MMIFLLAIMFQPPGRIIDRGLPVLNINDQVGLARVNVTWDGDPPEFSGDHFTLPELDPDDRWVITTITTWMSPGATAAETDNDLDFSDEPYVLSNDFQSLSLYLEIDGVLAVKSSGSFLPGTDLTSNQEISIQRVQYVHATEHDYQGRSGQYLPLYEVKFTGLDIHVPGNTMIKFGVDGTSNTGENWYNHSSNKDGGGVPADQSDDLYMYFENLGPSFLGTWNSDRNGPPGTYGGGGARISTDINVIVDGYVQLGVPTLSTTSLIVFVFGLMMLGICFVKARANELWKTQKPN